MLCLCYAQNYLLTHEFGRIVIYMGIEQVSFGARLDTDAPPDRVTRAVLEVIRTMGTASIELSPSLSALIENKPPTGRFINRLLDTKLCLPVEEGLVMALDWARRPERSKLAIQDTLAQTSVGKHFPDMAVPKEFMNARPNVRFVPPALRQYRHTGRLADMPALRYILTHGLDTEPITDATQAAAIIYDIQHNFPANASPEDKQRILSDVYQNLLTNLELHRITADPEGTVTRFTATPDEDMQPMDVPIPQNKLPFLGLLHPDLYDNYQGKWMTWWHRQDIDPDDSSSHNLYGRTQVTSTLNDLEKNHLISIDLACETAVVAIRIDTDATTAV
jgi:hypothetical protein